MKKFYSSIKLGLYHFIKAIFLLTDEFILLFQKRLFCMLFNLRAIIMRKDIRFTYDQELFYYAKTDAKRHFFKNRRQALNAYRFGLISRANYLKELYHLDEIEFQNGDIILDCGANVGDLYLSVTSLGASIKYIAFEPSKEEFSSLKRNIKDQVAVNKGLWKENTTLEFFLNSDFADSSIIRPRSYSTADTIEAIRLDDYADGIEFIKLLKVEAEGAEPEVFLGAQRILHKVEYISADLGFERGEEEQSTLFPVTNYLFKKGFVLEALNDERRVALFRNEKFLRK